MDAVTKTGGRAAPWKKGKLLGQKSSMRVRPRARRDTRARGVAGMVRPSPGTRAPGSSLDWKTLEGSHRCEPSFKYRPCLVSTDGFYDRRPCVPSSVSNYVRRWPNFAFEREWSPATLPFQPLKRWRLVADSAVSKRCMCTTNPIDVGIFPTCR